MKKALLVLLGFSVFLSACAGRGIKRKQLAYVERPAETIYLAAHDRLAKHDFPKAIALFDEVERQHPYSEWARRAMLMAAYADYQSNEYDDAINAANRFIALHPGSSSAPYAYYLIALCQFEQIIDVGRDQAKTREALDALRQVVRRFPNSDYARDARLKIDLTMDQLAGKEMTVGRFYERHGQTIAAIGRYKTVIKDYQTTTHAPEALERLVECYVRIGVIPEAVQVAAVLGYNYPGSQWYQDAYKIIARAGGPNATAALDEKDPDKRKNMFSRAWNRLF